MTTILRHGGEAHVVRPDRVYRTGVLTSIVGYQPQADVQAVAAAFTLGPPSGQALAGIRLAGLSGPTWLERVKMRLQSVFARKTVAVEAQTSGPPQNPGASQRAAAQQLAPDQAGRAMAVFSLVGGPGYARGHDKGINRAARVMAERRYASLYWAG